MIYAQTIIDRNTIGFWSKNSRGCMLCRIHEALFFDESQLLISDGDWVTEKPLFSDPSDWLDEDVYEHVKAEIDSWPTWKREGYLPMSN